MSNSVSPKIEKPFDAAISVLLYYLQSERDSIERTLDNLQRYQIQLDTYKRDWETRRKKEVSYVKALKKLGHTVPKQ